MKQFRNFMLATGVWAALMGGVVMVQAHADESIHQVGMSAQQKTTLVSYLKQRIARHKKMSMGEIVADLRKSADQNRTTLAQSGGVDLTAWDKAVNKSVDELKTISNKEAIVALETAQLQGILSSDNFMFLLTRTSLKGGKDCDNNNSCFGYSYGFAVVLTVVTIPIDLALLPITFIGSAVTGF